MSTKLNFPGSKARKNKKKGKHEILIGADDETDEYHDSTWHQNNNKSNKNKVPMNNKNKSFEYPPSHLKNGASNGKQMSASLPDKPDLATRHKSQEMIYEKLNDSSSKKKSKSKSKSKHHGKSKSALPDKRTAEKWKSRTSDPSTKDVEELRTRNGAKPLTIKINSHLNKKNGKKRATQKNGKSKSSKHHNHNNNNNGNDMDVSLADDMGGQQQILGDILIHVSSWNQLIAKNDPNVLKQNKDKKILGVGWKTVYCILDGQKFRFWDDMMDDEKQKDHKHNHRHNQRINYEDDEANVTVYLSEILTINKSIRSIDGEKYIIELTICGLKLLLSFSNIEQREYWHSLLSDYHLNYFIWRSTPLDEKKRRSKNVINGVYKLLHNGHNKKGSLNKDDTMKMNILYIEQILQRISSLNITRIIDLVPNECKFMSGRLIRVIMSIKFFFMSVLKSLSGADIPLPSREILIDYLSEIEKIKWNTVTNEILDHYADQCYRILFNLSFAFTSNARDEIMKLNQVIDNGPKPSSSTKKKSNGSKKKTKTTNNDSYDFQDKKIAEMKFEYESLQRSWKMHRDRLQEYVMAYRDAVAKLKHSYHQRDNLCKKIETLNQEKKKLNESIQLQSKNHDSMMEQAQQLAHKFSVVSQQMNGAMNNGGYTMNGMNNGYTMNGMNGMNGMSHHNGVQPQLIQQQTMPMNGYNSYGMNGMNQMNGQYHQYYQQQQQQQQNMNNGNNSMNGGEGGGGGPGAAGPGAQSQMNDNPNSAKLQQYTSHLQNLIQQRNDIMQTDPTNPALQVVIKQINECQQKISSMQQNANGANGMQMHQLQHI